MPKDYTADDYKRMLVNLLDVHYGGAVHHIGDGDGLLPDEAAEIREFWEGRIDETVRTFVGRRAAATDAKK